MKSNIWSGATATLAAEAAKVAVGMASPSPSPPPVRMSLEQLHKALIEKLLQMGEAVNDLFHDWYAVVPRRAQSCGPCKQCSTWMRHMPTHDCMMCAEPGSARRDIDRDGLISKREFALGIRSLGLPVQQAPFVEISTPARQVRRSLRLSHAPRRSGRIQRLVRHFRRKSVWHY